MSFRPTWDYKMSHDVALGCLICTNLVLTDVQDFKEKSLGKAHCDMQWLRDSRRFSMKNLRLTDLAQLQTKILLVPVMFKVSYFPSLSLSLSSSRLHFRSFWSCSALPVYHGCCYLNLSLWGGSTTRKLGRWVWHPSLLGFACIPWMLLPKPLFMRWAAQQEN